MISCYGRSYGATEHCRTCRWAKWCSTAADPPLYADHSPAPEHLEHVLRRELRARLGRTPSAGERQEEERHLYTRTDLFEVIGFMAALDHRALALLEEKIREPSLRLAELARHQGVSRQALHRLVVQRLSRIPELGAVITYHRHRNKINKETTFQEEVCRIRQQIRSKRLLKSKKNWNCLKNWSFLNPSLNLSKMSIIRGTAIWKSGSSGSTAPGHK